MGVCLPYLADFNLASTLHTSVLPSQQSNRFRLIPLYVELYSVCRYLYALSLTVTHFPPCAYRLSLHR
jgi:hypothetical protein